jgi:hypothetical protein
MSTERLTTVKIFSIIQAKFRIILLNNQVRDDWKWLDFLLLLCCQWFLDAALAT